MEEGLLATLSMLSDVAGGIVTAVIIPLAGYWGYREYNKRKAEAEAKKAEADTITQYAARWTSWKSSTCPYTGILSDASQTDGRTRMRLITGCTSWTGCNIRVSCNAVLTALKQH